MAIKLEDKKAVVAEIAEEAASAVSAVAADYRGLTVTEMNALRAKARKAGVYMRVARNTLMRRALKGTEFECLAESLKGPIFLALSREDPGAAARLVRDAAANLEKLQVKALAIGGKLLSAKDLKAVADLPTLHQALTMLVTVMKQPIAMFVRTLAEPHAKLARTVAAIRDKKAA